MRTLEKVVAEVLECYEAERLPGYPTVCLERVVGDHTEEYQQLEGEVRRGELDDEAAEMCLVESISRNLDRWAYSKG